MRVLNVCAQTLISATLMATDLQQFTVRLEHGRQSHRI